MEFEKTEQLNTENGWVEKKNLDNEIPLDTLIVRKQPQFVETVDDELIIFNEDNGYFFALNKAGEEVWHKTETTIKFGDLVKHFESNYSLSQNDLMTILSDFFYTSIEPSPFTFEPALPLTSKRASTFSLPSDFPFVPTMTLVSPDPVSTKLVVDPFENEQNTQGPS